MSLSTSDGSELLRPRYSLSATLLPWLVQPLWGLDQRASSARLGTSSAEGSVPSRPLGRAYSWEPRDGER
jgi:hypothetical protein